MPLKRRRPVACADLAHLIATAPDEVGRRMETDLRSRAAHAAAVDGARRTPALLDVLWTAFTGDLYTVCVKVWIAAADVAPANVPRAEWTRRFSVALDAMRGLALTIAMQPRTPPVQRDPWPVLRRELTGLLDRTS